MLYDENNKVFVYNSNFEFRGINDREWINYTMFFKGIMAWCKHTTLTIPKLKSGSEQEYQMPKIIQCILK